MRDNKPAKTTAAARRVPNAARPRMRHYETLEALYVAVLEWCRSYVRGKNPDCDIAKLERDAQSLGV